MKKAFINQRTFVPAIWEIVWGAVLLYGSASITRAAEPRQWPVELSVGRFQIHSDFDVPTATALSPQLTQLSEDMQAVLGIGSGDSPVHVVLFQSAHEYNRYMHNYFPQLPARRALYIQDRGPGMLFAHWHADVATDLRHEITHALLNDGAPPLPLWLDEGLAEYFEVERELRFSGSDYLPTVRQRSGQGIVPSLLELEEINDLQQFQATHYRDSWSWVHFLLHRSLATRELLVKYLNGQRGGREQLSLSRQLQQLTPDLNADFRAHFDVLSAP